MNANSLDDFLNKYRHLVTFVLLTILVLIVFQNFLFGNLYYLFKDIGSDTLNVSYPNFVYIAKYIRTDGFPTWSFYDGMGQNCMSNSLFDPFNWIAYLSDPDILPSVIICIELVKIYVAAIFFYLFLRLWNLSSVSIIIGTLLFSFSGYLIVGGSWFLFSTEVCFLAIILFAFEMLYSKNKWYFFPIAVALIAIFQPFDLYLFGFFILIYFLFKHFNADEVTWKKFFNVTLKMVGCGLLGIFISSFLFVNFLLLILDSPRVDGNSSYFNILFSRHIFFRESRIFYLTAIMRFFSNDLMGNGSNFKGWRNYFEAPIFYIGLLPLLLIPQLLILKIKSQNLFSKSKIIYVFIILIFIIPVIFPFFRYSLWLYSGDYFRVFAFFIALFLLFFSLKVLNEIDTLKNINLILLVLTTFVLLFILYYPSNLSSQLINQEHRNIIKNFIILYTLLILFLKLKKIKSLFRIILILMVCIEIGYMNYHTVNSRNAMTHAEMTQKVGYNDYSIDAIKYIYAHDKQFFRVNKDFLSSPTIHLSYNDSKVQGFFGTSSFASFNQKYYIRFLEEMNIIKKGNEHESRWAPGLGMRPLLLNLASNKYHLSNIQNSFFLKIGYDSITIFDDVRLFKNMHFLPLGFTYDKYIYISDFLKLSPFQKDITLQKALVIENPVKNVIDKLKVFNLKDTCQDYNYNDYYNDFYSDYFDDVKHLKQDTLSITYFSQKRIIGNINPKSNKVLFFSIPYDRGWNAMIDNKKVKPILSNIGFMGFLLEPGFHKIELSYLPPYFYESLIISIIAILIYVGLILFYRKYAD